MNDDRRLSHYPHITAFLNKSRKMGVTLGTVGLKSGRTIDGVISLIDSEGNLVPDHTQKREATDLCIHVSDKTDRPFYICFAAIESLSF